MHLNLRAASAAIALFTAGPALAADLPGPLPDLPSIGLGRAPVPTFAWDGAYFGFNIGEAPDNTARIREHGVTALDAGIGTNLPGRMTQDVDGVLGGGQIGYNVSMPIPGSPFGALVTPGAARLVAGLEADATSINGLSASNSTRTDPLGVSATSRFRSGTDFLTTVRARVGVAFGDVMVYGTGGYAVGDVVDRAIFTSPAAPGTVQYFGRNSGLQNGLAYGGGMEFAIGPIPFLSSVPLLSGMFTGAPTVRIEYLTYDLGARTMLVRNQDGAAGSGYVTRTAFGGDLIRAGVNYNF